jgi:hypothetical protein
VPKITNTVACGFPFFSQKKQTTLSLVLRSAAIGTGGISLLIGTLILTNLINLQSVADGVRWIPLSTGIPLVIGGICIKIVKKEKNPQNYSFLEVKGTRELTEEEKDLQEEDGVPEFQVLVRSITRETIIADYFDVVYQSPNINGIEEADLVCLCEKHNSPTQRQLNALLTDFFAPEGALLLVEGVTQSEEVDQKEVPSIAAIKRRFPVEGWDIEHSYIVNQEYLKKKRQLEIELNQLQLEWRVATDKKQRIDLSKKIVEKAKENDSMFQKTFGNRSDEEWDAIRKKEFPERVTSMIETLQAKEEKKVYAFAGAAHFVDHSNVWGNDFSLKTFYSYVQTRKVLILKPKEKFIEYDERDINAIAKSFLDSNV